MDIPTPPLGTADDPPIPSHLSTSLTTSTLQTPSLPTHSPLPLSKLPLPPQPCKQPLETATAEFIEKGWRLVSELT
jgi:hypothetical protein